MVAFGSKSDPPDASFVMVVVVVVTETHRMDSIGEQLGKSRQAGDYEFALCFRIIFPRRNNKSLAHFLIPR